MQAFSAQDIQGAYNHVGFSDQELLCLLVGKKGTQLANEIGGNIGQLFARGLAGTKTPLTERERQRIMAAVLLGRRFNVAVASSKPTITGPELAAEIARSELRYREREYMLVIYLNNSHQVISHDKMFCGTIDEVHVYKRDIVKTALLTNASAVILAHNHPSGNPNPSESDITLTRQVKGALSIVDIRLLDHIIVTDSKETSLQQMGHI